jgi:succinate-acetate transporter protein
MIEPQINTVTIKDTSASAGPLGLSAFGICTILLSLTNAGIIPFDAMVLSMGLFYGGMTQIIVGLLEGRKGNTFGLVAFTSYGIFWVAFVAMNVMPALGAMAAPSGAAINAFLIMWCIFTIILFVATLKLPKVLRILFGALIVLFVLLILGGLTGNPSFSTMAGYEGLIVGSLSLYGSAAFLLNEIYGRTLLPVG